MRGVKGEGFLRGECGARADEGARVCVCVIADLLVDACMVACVRVGGGGWGVHVWEEQHPDP